MRKGAQQDVPSRQAGSPWLEITENVGVAVSCCIVAVMTLGITVSVVLRNLDRPAIPGLTELTEFGLLWAVLLAAPQVLGRRGHVRIEAIQDFAGQRLVRIVDLIADLIVTLVCLVLTVGGVWVVWTSYGSQTVVSGVLQAPQWLVLCVIPLSGAIMSLRSMWFLKEGLLDPNRALPNGKAVTDRMLPDLDVDSEPDNGAGRK